MIWGIRVFCFWRATYWLNVYRGNPWYGYLLIISIFHSQFSINKTMTKEWKWTKSKTIVFVVALKRAVLNGSTKSRLKIFREVFVRGRNNFFFYKFLILLDRLRLSIEVIVSNNYFWNYNSFIRVGGGDTGVRTSRFLYPALPLPVPLSPDSRPFPSCSRLL